MIFSLFFFSLHLFLKNSRTEYLTVRGFQAPFKIHIIAFYLNLLIDTNLFTNDFFFLQIVRRGGQRQGESGEGSVGQAYDLVLPIHRRRLEPAAAAASAAAVTPAVRCGGISTRIRQAFASNSESRRNNSSTTTTITTTTTTTTVITTTTIIAPLFIPRPLRGNSTSATE